MSKQWTDQEGNTIIVEVDTEEPVDVVSPGFACPACGENDSDQLLILDDGHIRCLSCQREYTIP